MFYAIKRFGVGANILALFSTTARVAVLCMTAAQSGVITPIAPVTYSTKLHLTVAGPLRLIPNSLLSPMDTNSSYIQLFIVVVVKQIFVKLFSDFFQIFIK